MKDHGNSSPVINGSNGNSSAVSNGYMKPGDSNLGQKTGSCLAMDNRLLDEHCSEQSLNASSLDRKTSVREDSTAMTIEFLRARLLSERSVSKAASQKAEQLAQKVMELERQLQIVVEERKKAEAAAEEALARLENGGMTDYSENFDSGTDRDGAACESRDLEGISNGTTLRPGSAGEEEETSIVIPLGKIGSEERSPSSEFDIGEIDRIDPSRHIRRGLSWQARGNSCSHHEKNAKKTLNQALGRKYTNSSHYVGTSDGESGSKRRIGKSCRQIKRKETRQINKEEQRVLSGCSADDMEGPADSTSEDFSHSGQKEGEDQSTKTFEDKVEDDFEGSCHNGDEKAILSNSSNQAAEEGDEIDSTIEQVGGQMSGEKCNARVHMEYIISHPAEDQIKQSESGSGSDKDMEMERALEQQADLIGQYEAEEDAQREWEEKFRELNLTAQLSMDCCKHEKQVGGAEKANEQKVVHMSSSKNVAGILNNEKKVEVESSYQSTSGKFSIQNVEMLAISQAIEVVNDKSQEGTANEALQDMGKNKSEIPQVHHNKLVSESNNWCSRGCSSDMSLLESATIEVVNSTKNGNHLKDVSIEKMPEHAQRDGCVINYEKSVAQEEGEWAFQSHALSSVTGVHCSNKQTTGVLSVSVAENVIELDCQDIRPNITEEPSSVLEKHISFATGKNVRLAPSTPRIDVKIADAMHGVGTVNISTTKLPTSDVVNRVPDAMQAQKKVGSTELATQPAQLGQFCTESKLGTSGYEISSGEGLMFSAGDKLHGEEALQHTSHGGILRNCIQKTKVNIPEEVQGNSQSWHGGYNDEQGVPMMQGFYQKDPAANMTRGRMHPQVFVNPVQYMRTAETEHMQMQGQKKNQEHFVKTDFHSRAGTSDANLATRSQGIIKGRPISGQFDRDHVVSNSNMASMLDAAPSMSTHSVGGGSSQTSRHGSRSSEHLDVGGSSLANQFTENRFRRPPFPDRHHHFVMNKFDTAFGPRGRYVPAVDSARTTHAFEGEMLSMGHVTSSTAKQRVGGGRFQTSWHGFGSSEHSDVGSSSMANQFSESKLSLQPFLDPHHPSIMNKTDPASVRGSVPIPQSTFGRNKHLFQEIEGTLNMNQCSAGYKFPSNYQDHSRSMYNNHLTIPTTGNAGCSSGRDVEPSFKLHAENHTREESCVSQTNQDHVHGRVQGQQPASHFQKDLFRDALMALQLAKLQLRNTLDKTLTTSQHFNQVARFVQEENTQKASRSCNSPEAPINCAELFRLPSEVVYRLPSQIGVSRPCLADRNHHILMGTPRSLSTHANGRESPSLHIKNNENDVILSRRDWLSADNQNGQVNKTDPSIQIYP